MESDLKTCRQCNEVKPVTEYAKRAQSEDGLQPKCRECMRAYNAKRNAKVRAANPPKIAKPKQNTVKKKTRSADGRAYGPLGIYCRYNPNRVIRETANYVWVKLTVIESVELGMFADEYDWEERCYIIHRDRLHDPYRATSS